MGLDDLVIRKHTAPLEAELDHQKEQKAVWKKLAHNLAKALRKYQEANPIHNDSEAELFDAGKGPLEAFDKQVEDSRPRRR